MSVDRTLRDLVGKCFDVPKSSHDIIAEINAEESSLVCDVSFCSAVGTALKVLAKRKNYLSDGFNEQKGAFEYYLTDPEAAEKDTDLDKSTRTTFHPQQGTGL